MFSSSAEYWKAYAELLSKTNDETAADETAHDPKVSEAPEVIWLQYGDIERDCTHAELYRDGDVTWCDNQQFESDVMYVRADKAQAERDGLRAVLLECQMHLACNAVNDDLVALYGRVRAALGEAIQHRGS